MSQMTLLDLAKLRGNDAVVGLIEENRLVAPEVTRIPARTIAGFTYQTVTRKKQTPTAKFLGVNDTYPTGKDVFENSLIQCFLIGQLVKVSKALLQVSGDSIEALQSLEASRVLRDALLTIGSQTFYGVGNDAKGFPGLAAAVNSDFDIDAAGTGAGRFDIYGVKLGQQDVSYVYGGNSTFALSDFKEQVLNDIPSFVADMGAWVGLQVANKYSVGRIKNLKGDSGSTALTDKAIAALLKAMPVGNRPDVLFVNRDAAYSLQASRSTTVNAVGSKSGTGTEVWAPAPIESNGIPIVVTDSLVTTTA